MERRDRLRRMRRLFHRRSVEANVDDEIAFHLAAREADLLRSGVAPEEARRRARAEFGDVGAARAELAAYDRRVQGRRVRTGRLTDLAADLRLAARRLAREPGFLAAALLTLALGIGANIGIAAVADAVLLHPLPYPRADRLVYLWETKGGDVSDRSEASYPDFVDLRAGAGDVLTGLEGFDPGNATTTTGGVAARIRVTSVTPGFLDLLGARPALGRFLRRDEDVPGGVPVALVSHRYWREALGADPAILGRAVTLDGEPYTVVGVVERGFHFALGGDPDVWVPIGASAARRERRFNHWLRPIGRLRDGVSLASAEATLAGVMGRLAATYPETNAGRSVAVVPLRDQVIGGIRPIVVGLIAALALVLLIVCTNLASLALARGLGRAREFAVRAALGASRGRLARQILTESVMIAVLGAAVGALAAGPVVRIVIAAVPEGTRSGLPFLNGVQVGAPILAYGMLLAVVVGTAFGAAPLVALRRLSSGLLGAGAIRIVGPGRGRLRPALVIGQVALTTALLVGAGLLTRSLYALLGGDPGFATDRIVTMRVAFDQPRYQEEGVREGFLAALVDRTRALPGVASVGGVSQLPLNGGGTNTFRVEGEPEPDPAARPEAVMRGVLGDYFATLRIPLIAGRDIGPDDHRLGTRVLLMNRSLAERLSPGRSIVGRELRFYAFPDSTWTVVGVVGDVKTDALDAAVPPTIYYSAITGNDYRTSLVVATTGEPTTLIAPLRATLAALDPNVPGYGVGTMEEYLAQSPAVAARRLSLVLIATFAGLALTLVVVGLYGVLAFQVTQRRREIGVRLALGATGSRVMGAVLGQGVRLAGAGIALGLALALAGGRVLGTLLYGVRPGDPMTLAAVVALSALTAVAACWLPARRAARVDPMETLRAD